MNKTDDLEMQRRDFAASLAHSVKERLKRGEIQTFKPVLDEGPGVRVFETMEDYRKWCEENLPRWLGYRRLTDNEWDEQVRIAMET